MLLLKKLKIINLKCIDNLEINFSNTINLIIGNNGRGKSSIVDAIQICLLPNSIRNLQEYIQNGKERMEVSLEFEWEKNNIVSSVSVDKSGKKEVNLKLNNKVLSKKTEVYKVLKDLGFDSEIFLNSCLSKQHESTFLLTRNKSTQISLIKSLFDLSKIENVNSFIKEKSKSFKLKYEEALGKIEDLIKVKEGIERSIRENFNIPEIMEEKKLKKLENLLKRLENKYKKLKDIKENNLKYYEYEKKMLEKKSLISILLKEKNTFLSQTKDLDKLKSILKKMENHKNFLGLKYSEYKDKFIELKNLYEKYELKKNMALVFKRLKKDKTNKYKEYEKIKLLMSELEGEYLKYNEIIKDLENIEKLENSVKERLELVKQKKCPTCGREFENYEEEEKKLNDKISELNLIKKNIQETISKLVISKQKYEELSTKLNNLEISINEIKNNITLFLKDFKEIKIDKKLLKRNDSKRIEKLKDSYFSKTKKYENKISYINDRIKEKEIIQKRVKEISLKIKEEVKYFKILKKEKPTLLKKEFYFNEKRFQKLKDAYGTEINKIKLREMREKALKESLKTVKEIENNIEKIRKDSENYINLNKKLEEIFKISSLDFSFWILKEYISEITNYCNKLFSMVYPKYKVSIDVLEDSSLEINLINNYDNTKLNCKLSSGFELQLLSLVLRKAFSNYYGFNVLILDEADESASEDNSELLFDLILRRSNFQIIYISHKQYISQLQNYNKIIL